MDLKRIEELAEDKDLDRAYIVSGFMTFDNEFDLDCTGLEYSIDELPKNWEDLANEEKEKLIEKVLEFYIEAEFELDINQFARCAMIYQKEILNGTFNKWEFYNRYHDYYC